MYLIRLQLVYLQEEKKQSAFSSVETLHKPDEGTDSRVPSEVFHQCGVFWHLLNVLPVFI